MAAESAAEKVVAAESVADKAAVAVPDEAS